MMRSASLVSCLFLITSLVGAQTSPTITKTGTTAASFLKIGVGARSIAMGGAYTAAANDVSSIYWNPAGLASMGGSQAMFNHVNWIADVQYDVAAAALPVEGFGTIGASFASMNVGDMDVTTVSEPEGTGERFTAGGTEMGI